MRLASSVAILTVCSLINSSVCPYAKSMSALNRAAPLGCASRLHCSIQLLFIAGSRASCAALIVLSSSMVGVLWGPMVMCSELFGNRPAFIMFRRCLAPGPSRCCGHEAPSLLVRFHFNAPHVLQNSSVVSSLTVHALKLCLTAACCVLFTPARALLAFGGGGCRLRLPGGRCCFGCSMSMSLCSSWDMITH